MTKKETAVEWFSNKTWKLKVRLENKEISIGEYGVTYVELYNQALAMERFEHSQTWDAALDKYEVRAGNYMRAYEDFDDYYEQFKQD